MTEKQELELYQLFKRNRIALLDPTYDPDFSISDGGKISINWKSFDDRLDKYFSGKAFTSEYGYSNGPGYGEPIETFVLPFDVYGKHGTKGWPDVGKPDVERDPANKAVYIDCIKKVREHFESSYRSSENRYYSLSERAGRVIFPGSMEQDGLLRRSFRTYYPEALFRIDGGYTEEALQIVKNSITSWASHTIEYDFDNNKKVPGYGH